MWTVCVLVECNVLNIMTTWRSVHYIFSQNGKYCLSVLEMHVYRLTMQRRRLCRGVCSQIHLVPPFALARRKTPVLPLVPVITLAEAFTRETYPWTTLTSVMTAALCAWWCLGLELTRFLSLPGPMGVLWDRITQLLITHPHLGLAILCDHTIYGAFTDCRLRLAHSTAIVVSLLSGFDVDFC